jgi:transposase
VVTGGVDTHVDVRVAAALDPIGGVLGVESFATSPAGYRQLLEWLSSFGTVARVGVEGTGAYGAGLSRYLHRHGIEVIEVDRANRQARRQARKSDPADAVEAARAAQSGRARGLAKTRDGNGRGDPGVAGHQAVVTVDAGEDAVPDEAFAVHRA